MVKQLKPTGELDEIHTARVQRIGHNLGYVHAVELNDLPVAVTASGVCLTAPGMAPSSAISALIT